VTEPVLWHLKVSHYNEKVRWALDYKGIAHRRKALVPGQHIKVARKLTGEDTTPVVEFDGEAVRDSTRIIERLERDWPEPALYPADPEERRRALELEEFFDEELGPYIRRLNIHHMLPAPDLFFGAFVPDMGRAQLAAARTAWPVLRRRLRTTFEIDDASVQTALEKCRAATQRLHDERGPSGYLVGDEFSVADLTAAALMAPTIAPEQFPYPQPHRGDERLADLRELLDESWVREMYARHRGVSAEVAAA
jgi:glutathione S-transferase